MELTKIAGSGQTDLFKVIRQFVGFNRDLAMSSNKFTGSVKSARGAFISMLMKNAQRPENRIIEQHFDSTFYLASNPAIAKSGLDPLAHYLDQGWKQGFDPSPDFNTEFYLRQNPDVRDAGINPFKHFLEYGKAEGRLSSPATEEAPQAGPTIDLPPDVSDDDLQLIRRHFDAAFYLQSNPLVARSGLDPVVHYLTIGWKDGHDPSHVFDTVFYLDQYSDVRDAQVNPFLHYLRFGKAEGRFPTAHKQFLTSTITADHEFAIIIRFLLKTLYPKLKNFELELANRFIIYMFHSEHYRALLGLDPALSRAELLAHYVLVGFAKGISPGPLFDEEHYKQQLNRRGVSHPVGDEPYIQHWISRGVNLRIVPTLIFDEDQYLSRNPDLKHFPGWLFEHFIMAGVEEGRQFIDRLQINSGTLRQTAAIGDTGTVMFLDWITSTRHHAALPQEIQRPSAFWASDVASDIFRQVNDIEPDIGGMDRYKFSIAPPWHDVGYLDFRTISNAIPAGRFDDVILMPFCKLGGADFVAGVLAKCLHSKGRKVLVLRTERSDWERPDWFPEDTPSVDLSTQLNALPEQDAVRILYQIIRATECKNVFNVNSFRGFKLIERFGKQLSFNTRIHVYYFCADRDADGFEVGYPIWFFSNIVMNLSSAIFDTEDLRRTLCERYNLDPDMAAKTRTLYTPAMTAPPEALAAERQVKMIGDRKRPRILWAGRLDRQKRFDLVVEIACQMPEVDFDCWGKAVLDQPPETASLPDNMRLHGPFRQFHELPLEDCDGWLYTSAWDGLPTILIECASFGMPITASAVGGVPELITDETGWPVTDTEDVYAYVSALHEMLQSGNERIARAQKLQKLIRERHQMLTYAEQISALLEI